MCKTRYYRSKAVKPDPTMRIFIDHFPAGGSRHHRGGQSPRGVLGLKQCSGGGDIHQSNIHMDVRTQGFLAEHCDVMR